MIELGKYNLLEVARDMSPGMYLEDKEGNSVLLPGKLITNDIEVGDFLEVFIYRDNDERLIATTEEALITLYEFAFLKVSEVSDYGAFMDMGIDKELFVPFREQKLKMEAGKSYLVYMYLDGQTDRLTGSAKIEQFLDNEELTVEEGDEVLIKIWNKTDIGYNVIINNLHRGLLYENEVFQHIRIGDEKTAFIYKIREEGKIDVRLQKEGYSKIEENAQKILDVLKRKEGYLLLTDKSSPDRIKNVLGMSKKTFKKSIGTLYKQKLITLEEKGIRLVE